MSSNHLRAACAALAIAAFAAPAMAADLSRPAPVAAAEPYPATIQAYTFNWTGAYAGANIGGRWVDDRVRRSGAKAFDLDSASAAGGLQLGYQMQTGRFVYGVEADVGYGDNSKTRSVAGGRIGHDLDWTGTVRGRAGIAFDRLLVYGTGGLAIANAESRGSGGGNSARTSETLTGWTAGGGLEYALTDRISVRGEYLYADYGSRSVAYPGTGLGKSKEDVRSNLARLGVNFKF